MNYSRSAILHAAGMNYSRSAIFSQGMVSQGMLSNGTRSSLALAGCYTKMLDSRRRAGEKTGNPILSGFPDCCLASTGGFEPLTYRLGGARNGQKRSFLTTFQSNVHSNKNEYFLKLKAFFHVTKQIWKWTIVLKLTGTWWFIWAGS